MISIIINIKLTDMSRRIIILKISYKARDNPRNYQFERLLPLLNEIAGSQVPSPKISSYSEPVNYPRYR